MIVLAENTPYMQGRAPIKREFADGLVMLAELTVKPDRLEDFLDYTVANLSVSRSYPGSILFDILVAETVPEKVTFYDVWESLEAQQTYMAWRVEAGDLTKLLSLLACEPKFTALRKISA